MSVEGGAVRQLLWTERLAGKRVRRKAIPKDESVKKCVSEYAGA